MKGPKVGWRLVSRFSSVAVAFAVTAGAMAQSVIGMLGQTVAKTTIYRQPSTKSAKLYTVQAYEYLVVGKSPHAGWTKVVMSDGTVGYIATEAVAELPYEVKTQADRNARGSTGPSRGATSNGADPRGAMAGYALNFVGTKYVWGGNSLTEGVDCSGFVQQLYGKIGIQLPRTASTQANVGEPIYNLEDLRAGDRLYFWDAKLGKIGHTGIYLGNGYFVHSSSSEKSVVTDFLGKKHWLDKLVSARR